MFFNPHTDPNRNKTYDSFIYQGKIVNVSISYHGTREKGYVLTIMRLPSSDGLLDENLACKIAYKMNNFLCYHDNTEYKVELLYTYKYIDKEKGTFVFELKEDVQTDKKIYWDLLKENKTIDYILGKDHLNFINLLIKYANDKEAKESIRDYIIRFNANTSEKDVDNFLQGVYNNQTYKDKVERDSKNRL